MKKLLWTIYGMTLFMPVFAYMVSGHKFSWAIFAGYICVDLFLVYKFVRLCQKN